MTNINIENTYKSLSQREQILLRPDTVIGSIETIIDTMWIVTEDNLLVKKEIEYNPGFMKLPDELIVNVCDQMVKPYEENNTIEHRCTVMKVNVDKEEGIISVYNDGDGIPVVIHKEKMLYVPELVLGNLNTSSNYDDDKKKITGGRNGLGAKAVNIFSTEFTVETVDHRAKKKYIQTFKNNLEIKEPPKITVCKTKPYTLIKFKPDLARFGLTTISDEHVALIKKRVFDTIATAPKGMKPKVYFNEILLPVNTADKYMAMYYPDCDKTQKLFTEVNDRWKVGVMFVPEVRNPHISYVNSICTVKGGTHVKYIEDQIFKKLTEVIKGKYKDVTRLNSNLIRDHLVIFVNCLIENPAFSSQTKEELTTKSNKFGSKCDLDDKFLDKIAKTGIVEYVIENLKSKESNVLKQTDGKMTTRLKGIPKLADADMAGTSKESGKCGLILTEGDSALASAFSGLAVVGRKYYGAFPLKGKLLNVRDASPAQVSTNEELVNIKKIIGLQHNKKYTSVSELRYGQIILMTDQDSVTGDTPLVLRNSKGEIEIRTIDSLCNKWNHTTNTIGNENIQTISVKEYGNTDYEVWTNLGWTKIEHIMRHRVKKRIFRILTHTGCVDVTEDHSLLDSNGNKISPKDCNVNDTLLHSNYYFEHNKIDIPDDLSSLNGKELMNLAKELKIQNYQTKKDTLNNKIREFKTKTYIPESKIDYGISADEAYVMGLFFADGTCGVYKWEYTYKHKNRPRAYTTSYNWAITNTNRPFLDKAKTILEKYYDYEFVINEDRHNKLNRENCNMVYKLQINGCKITENIVQNYRNMFYDDYKNKKVPKEILNSPYEVRFNFFHGFYDGDGHKGSKWYSDQSKKKCDKLFFDVNGKITAQGLYYLCRSIGYEVTMNHNVKKPKIYTLNLTRGTIQDNPNRIKKIIDLGTTEQYVYDLETSNHHFQAGVGAIIAHNTDGTHIAGLLINFIHYFWPELLKINPSFIRRLTTPIVKARNTKNKKILTFYNLPKYEEWKNTDDFNLKDWTIKYYKGLGTSTSTEAKEYFEDMSNRLINYRWDDHTNDSINLAFKKEFADKRKEWLVNYSVDSILDNSQKEVSFTEFINKDLIHFSNSDNDRSIPCVIDGFKPSQRKVLYASYLTGLDKKNEELKVAQLSGFVSFKTSYHHGEASLNHTIIGMAQDFIGSNNLNILVPNGQFGTRLSAKDASAPRYIFTSINPIMKYVFRKEDTEILEYLQDDGTSIEPNTYQPIIPMVLVNGAVGIGTGYSTFIPSYNPLDIIENLRKKINKIEMEDMTPYYRHFTGKINKINDHKYEVKGVYSVKSNTVEVKELPVGTWTNSYKEFLEKKIEKKVIDDYKEYSTDTTVDFKIIFKNGSLSKLIEENKLESELGLTSIINLTNMHLHTSPYDGGISRIKKYNSILEIINDFFVTRQIAYVKRKDLQLKILEHEMLILKFKVQFILHKLDGTIVVENKEYEEVINTLQNLQYPQLGTHYKDSENKSYNYITNIQLFSLTKNKKEELENQLKKKVMEFETLQKKTIEEIWLDELDQLKNEIMLISNGF